MKILILGDSFCGVNDNDSWMQQLKKITGATVDCYGLNGCSNWFIYENFLKYVNASYDYIFIIFTNECRIPHVEGNPEHCHVSNLDSLTTWSFDDQSLNAALVSYIKWFYHVPLQKFISNNIINSIQQYPLHSHQKIVWLNGLMDPVMFDVVATGIPIKGQLCTYSQREIKDSLENNLALQKKVIKKMNEGTFYDPRTNHFSKINQLQLAKFCASIIEKNKNNTLSNTDLNLEMVEWERNPEKLDIGIVSHE